MLRFLRVTEEIKLGIPNKMEVLSPSVPRLLWDVCRDWTICTKAPMVASGSNGKCAVSGANRGGQLIMPSIGEGVEQL